MRPIRRSRLNNGSGIELGEALAEIRQSTPGKGGASTWREASESLVGYRKAQYLLKIHSQLKKLGIEESEIRDMGWTRLMILEPKLRTLSKRKALQLITWARNHTCAQIKARVAGSVAKNPNIESLVLEVTHAQKRDIVNGCRHVMQSKNLTLGQAVARIFA
jgi:hypothetical protein